MSIIIKGMKMPESCQKCPMLEGDHYDGLCHAAGRWLDDEEYWSWGYYDEYDIDPSKPLNCPLVELPPHGRLIDESDVMKSAEELRKSPWYNDEPYHAMRKDGFEMAIDMAVKDAPTVIEAEEAEV